MSIPMTLDERLADFLKWPKEYDMLGLLALIEDARQGLANQEDEIHELRERLETYEPKEISDAGGTATG